MEEKTAYDVHLHAFNLSHPSILAFARRATHDVAKELFRPRNVLQLALILGLGLALLLLAVLLVATCLIPPLYALVRGLGRAIWQRLKHLLDRAANLLLVLENDIASTFLLMEDCLREEGNRLLDSEGLHLAGECYERIVLTPLMIDFGYKSKTLPGKTQKPQFHYDIPAGKPIVEQVVDVFRAVRVYVETKSDELLQLKYPWLDPTTRRVFEIYPFLGLNPANYLTVDKVRELLEKYFAAYTGRREDFRAQLGQFDGNIDHLGNHAFAGIKVYPPLGFDPWPRNCGAACKKVELIYETCCEKGIPLTTHGGNGGFVAVRSRRELNDLTSVSKWARVLEEHRDLKLDIAHFPVARSERQRQDDVLALVLGYENVYVDISCHATDDHYYRGLRAVLDRLAAADAAKLIRRTLFGSDFAVNLMWIDSYNRYLDVFSRTDALTRAEKRAICSENPERFLFRS